MTEEKKEPGELVLAMARIAALEGECERLKRENKALLAQHVAAKRRISTNVIEAQGPTSGPRRNICVSTTIAKPHLLGERRLIQAHDLPDPPTPQEVADEILAKVKGRREADAKKEKP